MSEEYDVELIIIMFTEYGRTCKDIGCLSNQVCVLAEDPCTFGHSTNCGTYPTCKKKTEVEGGKSSITVV